VDFLTKRRRVLPRRFAPCVLALAAIVLTASGCGASDKPTKELLRSANPLTSDIYVQIRGPAGAVSYVAKAIETGAFTSLKTSAFTKYDNGSFVPPRLHHQLHQHRICLFAHTIQSVDSPKLQAWQGKKITMSVYGKKSSVLYCRLIGGVFLAAS
jgi:hypothetical protein